MVAGMHDETRALNPAPVAVPATKRPRGRPRKTDDERDDGNRRHALLSAAAQLFRLKGFAATTTRDIAAAAGMQSGSPFYHFKSKNDLLYAVMEEGMHTALARQKQVMHAGDPQGLSAAEQLRALVVAHFEVLLGPGNDFVPVMLYEWRSLQPRQRKSLALLIAEYESLWMPVLLMLHAQGRLRAPVGLARLLILGALNWSVQWFDPKKSASVKDLADAAVAMFLKES
jgi:AcrR family transcriptional regulator